MIFLSILTGLTSLMPILIVGIKGVFYSIDPEVMYVGNALSFIKIGQIQYIDHPGTPSILLVSFLLWPFRFYAKLVDHTPFVLWAFKNYSVVFLYLRMWQGILFALGTWIFLKAVKTSTDSVVMVVFSWLLLLIYSPFLRLGSGITPETISFLLSTIWVWILAKFLNRPDIGLIPVLGIISGIAVANKFTNLFLIVASVSLPIYLKHLDWRQKLVNSSFIFLMALAGFMMGTWSIRDKYRVLFGWVIKLATSTGIHAGGTKAIFDWPIYLQSLVALHHQIPWLFFGVALILLISIVKRKLFVLVLIFTIGVLVLAKYPLTYYQLSNYTVLTFLLTSLLSKMNKAFVVLACLFLLPLTSYTVNDYLKTTSLAMNRTKVLETYLENHPPKKATLWEWGRAKDPALLLTISPDWHGGIFEVEKLTMNLDAVELFPIPADKVFDLCWDQLFIQGVSVKSFIDKYPERRFEKEKITGSDNMFLLHSKHCTN